MLSRRRFLQASSLVSLSPLLPSILSNTARAAGADADAKVLVVIQLDGGNDGLNTVVPYADDAYGRARDKLRLETAELHKLDDHMALHRAMKAAKELYDEGRLCIVQGVGYPNPDRSHFRSMKIWQTASFDDAAHDAYGWLGKALDWRTQHAGGRRAADAIYVGEDQTPVALWGRRSSATALAQADDLHLTLDPVAGAERAAADDTLAQFVSREVLSAYAAADEFAEQQRTRGRASAKSEYPDTQLGNHLKLVSELLKSGSEGRVFYTSQSGYDTHSVQAYTHYRLLRDFSAATKAFLDDMKAAGLDDRVVLMAFSEFGRRVAENDSQGTDHGTAGPVFLAGAPVAGGLVGSAPDLTQLEDGDLKMQIDFRQVYAALLDDWLEIDSRAVLGQSFEKPRVLSKSLS
ncbi:MAG: DUF1501 domain-containing protein [Planctomycetota bacterium]|nr:MAG: DUF1501 domain-containing protein [Planctomycetota bacterium]